MTIQDIGSIGELVAAVATIATLGYLAVQIRANTRTSAFESHRDTMDTGIASVVADSAELADIFDRGLVDLGSLEGSESTRFTFLVSAMIKPCELGFQAHALGIGLHSSLSSYVSAVYFLRSPGGREWWQNNKRLFLPAFAQWLDKELGLDG